MLFAQFGKLISVIEKIQWSNILLLVDGRWLVIKLV